VEHESVVASFLMRRFEEDGRRLGHKRATLYVKNSNARARKFYEKCHYRYVHEVNSVIRMEKYLNDEE